MYLDALFLRNARKWVKDRASGAVNLYNKAKNSKVVKVIKTAANSRIGKVALKAAEVGSMFTASVPLYPSSLPSLLLLPQSLTLLTLFLLFRPSFFLYSLF